MQLKSVLVGTGVRINGHIILVEIDLKKDTNLEKELEEIKVKLMSIKKRTQRVNSERS